MSSAFRYFAQNAFKFAPIALLSLSATRPQAFFGSKHKKNQIKNRVYTSLLESNLPCEDRKDVL